MKKIINNILLFLLGISIIIVILYYAISNSIKEETLKESIRTNLLTGLIYNDNGEKTEIFKTIVRLTKLDESTVQKIIENETANKHITDIVNSIYDYNLTGDEKYKYTKEEIESIVENNIDQVLDEIDYQITTKDREEVTNYLKEKGDYIIDTIYSTNIGDYVK